MLLTSYTVSNAIIYIYAEFYDLVAVNIQHT